jgi:two-component system chemotaxis response regulator CheY
MRDIQPHRMCDALAAEHPILVVDDDGDIRQAIGEVLRIDGFAVREASDGQEAWDTLDDGFRPCLIVLDLMMPRMNGYEFRERQLMDPKLERIPVLVVSAAANDRELRRLGLKSHLKKPFDLDELIDAVQQVCRRSA